MQISKTAISLSASLVLLAIAATDAKLASVSSANTLLVPPLENAPRSLQLVLPDEDGNATDTEAEDTTTDAAQAGNETVTPTSEYHNESHDIDSHPDGCHCDGNTIHCDLRPEAENVEFHCIDDVVLEGRFPDPSGCYCNEKNELRCEAKPHYQDGGCLSGGVCKDRPACCDCSITDKDVCLAEGGTNVIPGGICEDLCRWPKMEEKCHCHEGVVDCGDGHGSKNDPNDFSSCHCHGDYVHCDTGEQEERCTCKSDALTCVAKLDVSSCHCHGDLVHCDTEEQEAACSCKSDKLTCDVDGHHDDHDDHDKHGAETDVSMLEFSSCHCHGDDVHCDTSEQEAACHCHDDELHCGEHDDSHDEHDHGDEALLDRSGPKPWGIVIGMCFVVNLTTLAGTFVVAGHWLRNLLCRGWNPSPETGPLWANVITPMFAAGALIATAFFLLLPESLHMIEGDLGGGDHGHDHDHRMLGGGSGEVAVTWRWGASILGGILFPVFLHAFVPHNVHEHTHSHDNVTATRDEAAALTPAAEADPEVADAVAENPTTDKDASGDKSSDNTEAGSDELSGDDEYVKFCGIRLKNLSLFVSYNLGEALHNFTDGVFIGAAYLGCGTALGNSVVLATVLHELPNQMAGYLVMVNQNGIDPYLALFLNFLFGMVVLLGGLLVLVVPMSNLLIGVIFAMGGGCFLHVAIFEMFGTTERNIKAKIHWLWALLSFTFGAVCIGLVLLDHEHCGGH